MLMSSQTVTSLCFIISLLVHDFVSWCVTPEHGWFVGGVMFLTLLLSELFPSCLLLLFLYLWFQLSPGRHRTGESRDKQRLQNPPNIMEILPVWWFINTWLNSRNTILLLKMGRKERAKAVSRSLLSTSISRRARCSYKGLSMASFTHQLVHINDVLPALLTHLLKQSKIQTFHQVSVLHVTSQELGLLDQLTPFLCCWLITENGH